AQRQGFVRWRTFDGQPSQDACLRRHVSRGRERKGRMDQDESGQLFGVLVGTGVFLMWICALVPGLLACLLLVAAFAVPLLLPVVPLVLLAGLFYLVRAILRADVRRIRWLRSLRRPAERAASRVTEPALVVEPSYRTHD